MKQNEIIDFFNEMAPTWDAHTIRNEAAIRDILDAGGRLTVAHSMSREAIQNCHAGKPQHVSKPLPTATALAQTMSEFLNVDVVVSDAQKYIVSGTRF